MADIQINLLPTSAALTGVELVPMDQGAGTVKSTLSAIRTFLTAANKVAADVGNGSSVIIDVVHNLGTRDVFVQCYRNVTPWDDVVPDVQRLDANTVRLIFSIAPTTAQFRAVVRT